MMVRRMNPAPRRAGDVSPPINVTTANPNFAKRESIAKRRGVSLVEMLVVIAVTTVITTLGATMIVALMRSEGDGARALARTTNLARLARDFRRDVRAGTDIQIRAEDAEQPAEMIVRVAADTAIIYRVQEDAVVRLERRDGENAGVETYALPEGHGRFEQRDDGRLAALVYSRPATVRSPGGPSILHHEFRIEAAPGRDLRFATPENKRPESP
jgi:prepilin-type N-terminal cleavage/methylation domain-containing protein